MSVIGQMKGPPPLRGRGEMGKVTHFIFGQVFNPDGFVELEQVRLVAGEVETEAFGVPWHLDFVLHECLCLRNEIFRVFLDVMVDYHVNILQHATYRVDFLRRESVVPEVKGCHLKACKRPWVRGIFW